MAKREGVTAGAIVLAGVLFHPFAGTNAKITPELQPSTPNHSVLDTTRAASGEGPWTASCHYWAPARKSLPAEEEASATSITHEFNTRTKKDQFTLQKPAEPSCVGSDNRWGIPSIGDMPSAATISAAVAVVPDPLHAHAALDFDRTIDALLQAASDNGYVESYYWLPWISPEDDAREAASLGADSKTEKHQRERQPGLIVLKRVPKVVDDLSHPKSMEGASFSDVVYLFLVSGTPVQGLFAPQLENALKYEGELQCMSTGSQWNPDSSPFCRPQNTNVNETQQKDATGHFTFQTSPAEQGTLAIIGPNNTGEAASLRAELQHSADYVKHSKIVIAGQTSGQLAALELTQGNGPEKPTYISFRAEGKFVQDQLQKLVADSGHHGNSIAFLVEDSTSLGQSTASDDKKFKAFEPTDSPATLRFPRGISLLRNAHEDSGSAPGGDGANTSSPFLRLSLRDTSVEDTVTHFSQGQSPLSQEAELMAITRQLRRFRTKFVVIVASDALDEIFLAEFLHRTLPDVRLVSLGGGDLLYERDFDNYQFIGGLSLSSYNLLAPVSSLPDVSAALRPFSSELSESVYNSASYIFWSSGNKPALANYRNIFDPLKSPLHPSLWLTAVGRDGYAPLGKASSCAGGNTANLPSIAEFDKHQLQSCSDRDTNNLSGNRLHEIYAIFLPSSDQNSNAWKLAEQKEPLHFKVNPALSWDVLCILASALCLIHVVCLYCADMWSPLTRDLAIDQNDEPARRALYIQIGAVMLFCIAFVVAYPLFAALPLIKPTQTPIIIASITILCGIACVVFSTIRIWPHTFGAKRTSHGAQRTLHPWLPKETISLFFKGARQRLRLSRTYARGRNCEDGLSANFRALTFFLFLAFLTAVCLPLSWIYICETVSSAKTQSFVGVFFSYRCLNPLSGVSPILPVVLLLSGWLIWSALQTRRLRFSTHSRPRIPGRTKGINAYPLYVADDDLAQSRNSLSATLFRDISCLLITRELLSRHIFKRRTIEASHIDERKVDTRSSLENITKQEARDQLKQEQDISVAVVNRRLERLRQTRITGLLFCVYFLLFLFVVLFVQAESLEHILFATGRFPTAYEALLKTLMFPLVMVTITGWIRMMLVWNSLRRGLLFQLESLPIRSAFNRTRREGWPSMMRQSGLEERWREMARSLESMRQMAHDENFDGSNFKTPSLNYDLSLKDYYNDLLSHIDDLMGWITMRKVTRNYATGHEDVVREFHKIRDRPSRKNKTELLLMYLIESEYAKFGTCLIERVLVPYWTFERTGMVEIEEPKSIPVHARKSKELGESGHMELHAGPAGEVPPHILVAEEFIVIRYISLIRAVLVNLRQIMTFVSCAFALTLVAWNSYPFRPREWIDTAFTFLLIILISGIIWIFAQMHRDPILNRITKTEASELGSEFYMRVAAFGAAPLLTWLAYQFPSIGSAIHKFVQPGLEVIK